MSSIRFKKLVFKNFMSYGNTLNTFVFNDGLTWCYGSNGFGKSTIVEALCFALYGDSYRGGNKLDLKNTLNQDVDLEVSLEFDMTAPGSNDAREYRLFRTMNAKGRIKFDIELLEDGKWVAQNKRAGYSQTDFENDILGFNEVLFKNVIAMNTQETQPFMELGAQKRREITESIIAMQMGLWKKENGKRLSEATLEFDLATQEYERMGVEISNLEGILVTLREERKGNIEALKAEVAKVSQEIGHNVNVAHEFDADIALIEANLSENNGIIATEGGIREALSRLGSAETAVKMLGQYTDAVETARKAYESVKERFKTMGKPATKQKFDDSQLLMTQISQEINSKSIEIARLRASYEQKKHIEDEIVTLANNMKVGTPCPTCGKPTTEEDVEKHKAGLREKWKSAHAETQAVLGSCNDADTQLNALKNRQDEASAALEAARTELASVEKFERESLQPAYSDYTSATAALERCRTTISASGVSVDEIVGKIAELQGQLGEIDKLKSDNVELSSRLATLKGNQTQALAPNEILKRRLDEANAEIAKLSSSTSEDSIGQTEAKLAEVRAARNTAENRMRTAGDTRSICNAIAEMCSDGGMKKMVFDIFIPSFNSAVKKNLARTNLPVSIVFDSTMDFTYSAGPGLAPTYKLLSQGQRRKVGFAISMAFRDFVALVGNFKVNFVSFDEVLDQSTDNNAMREMLGIIKEMVPDIGSAFIITHRGDVVSDMFDYKMEIRYNGAYSIVGPQQKI